MNAESAGSISKVNAGFRMINRRSRRPLADVNRMPGSDLHYHGMRALFGKDCYHPDTLMDGTRRLTYEIVLMLGHQKNEDLFHQTGLGWGRWTALVIVTMNLQSP
jgi:hypothetical protein